VVDRAGGCNHRPGIHVQAGYGRVAGHAAIKVLLVVVKTVALLNALWTNEQDDWDGRVTASEEPRAQ
jgi:hypothetical protein